MAPSANDEDSRPDEVPAFTAVVPAAGTGARMGGRKPLMPLAGAPILLHAIRRLRMARGCAGLVLAVHPDDMDEVEKCLEEAGGEQEGFGVAAIVEGGPNRQESVLAALRATDPGVPLVLIHDAVRPLVRLNVIERVAARAAESGAAIAAAPAVATVKEVGPDGAIRSTPPREALRMAQTPQGFRRELILEAHMKACRGQAFVGTDDALLVERLGRPVFVVEDRPDNIKITTPEDLVMAEAILAWQLREGLPEAQPFPLQSCPPGPPGDDLGFANARPAE